MIIMALGCDFGKTVRAGGSRKAGRLQISQSYFCNRSFVRCGKAWRQARSYEIHTALGNR